MPGDRDLWLLQFLSGGPRITAGFPCTRGSWFSPVALSCTQQKAKLIPSRKMSMVHTTMEENFLEGTLHFLSDFVSGQHCPPKEIISHLIRHILLNPHQGEILKDTYMLLMKIQMYVFPLPPHPGAAFVPSIKVILRGPHPRKGERFPP